MHRFQTGPQNGCKKRRGNVAPRNWAPRPTARPHRRAAISLYSICRQGSTAGWNNVPRTLQHPPWTESNSSNPPPLTTNLIFLGKCFSLSNPCQNYSNLNKKTSNPPPRSPLMFRPKKKKKKKIHHTANCKRMYRGYFFFGGGGGA